MDAESPDVANRFIDGKTGAGGLGVEDDFTALIIDQIARHAGGLVRPAPRIATDNFDHAAVDPALLVYLLHGNHHAGDRGAP